MKLLFRSTCDFMARVRADLRRPHPFAYERVGFIGASAAWGKDLLVLLADSYHPVADEDYVDDQTVGAMMGSEAIRKALEIALLARSPVGMFHVHLHDFPGAPRFSRIDLREQERFIPDFFSARSDVPHGALVLSPTSITGRAWLSRDSVVPIAEFNELGNRLRIIRPPQSRTGESVR
jgi:hypothetical protein